MRNNLEENPPMRMHLNEFSQPFGCWGQTQINREMQHYPQHPHNLHKISRTTFKHFDWADGDIIVFEDDTDDYRPLAWVVQGNDWVRLDWTSATRRQQSTIMMDRIAETMCQVIDGKIVCT